MKSFRAALISTLSALWVGVAVPAEPHQDFVCTSGASLRVISVFNLGDLDNQQKRAGSCRVDYTRDGTTRTVYSSKTGRAYCAARASQLVTSLAKSNYSCRAKTVETP